jgi:hypothetical protein
MMASDRSSIQRRRKHAAAFFPWTKELYRHQSLIVVFTGHFCLGWCCNFVSSECGQKASVKLLQNMVYNTTQHLPPHSATHCLYTVMYVYFGKVGGRGEVREKVERQQYTSIAPSSMEATIHKLGRNTNHE